MIKHLILISFLFASTNLFAQFTIGPRVGLGTAYSTLDETSNRISEGDAQYGFSIGAFARFGGEKLKIMPELLYTTSQTEIDFVDGSGANQVADSELDKIDVPINVVFQPISILNLHGGITGSYITSSSDGFIERTDEAVKNYKDFTFGYQFGAGVELGNLLLDLRYETGISDTADSNYAGLEFDERQSMIKAMVGFKLIGN